MLLFLWNLTEIALPAGSVVAEPNFCTGATGSVAVTGKADIAATGVYGTGVAGLLYAWADIDTTQTADWQQVSTVG